MGSKEALLFGKRSKNICPLARALRQRARLITKSFLVLFFKKELLCLCLTCVTLNASGYYQRDRAVWFQSCGAPTPVADCHAPLAALRGNAQIGWRATNGGAKPGTERRVGDRQMGDAPLFFDFHVFVCTNRRPDGHPKGSCAERGSEKLRDYMKARAKELGVERVRINTSGCLDRCEHGPCIVVYPEGIWYHVDTPADVDLVLQQHIVGGGRATALMLPAV